MPTEEEIRAFYEEVMDEYDKWLEKRGEPDPSYRAMREVLEWILGENEKPEI